VNGAVVVLWTPPRVGYVWPLSAGLSWEQTYRLERPVDKKTFDRVDAATVEAEEATIAYRFKSTGAISYEAW
jgi:hypothetical protein